MREFTVEAACPRCADPFEFVAHGRPRGHESRAVVYCRTCAHNYVVCIMLIDSSVNAGKVDV